MTTDIAADRLMRWDPSGTTGGDMEEYEYDGGNSSSRLFERSRIKALAGEYISIWPIYRLPSGRPPGTGDSKNSMTCESPLILAWSS